MYTNILSSTYKHNNALNTVINYQRDPEGQKVSEKCIEKMLYKID